MDIVPLVNPEILLNINNSAVPDVNSLDESKAWWLVSHSVFPRMAVLDGEISGVIIVLSDHSRYESDYFRWYTQRYKNFIYIDRVVVPARARGTGVATALYQEVDHFALKNGMAIAAEVYSDPPNIASLKFHEKMGFQEIGKQSHDNEGKTVTKFMKYFDMATPIRNQTT